MKFNKDCIRDILLKCEDLLIINDCGAMNDVPSNKLCEVLPNYTLAEIKYSVKKMKEANLLNVTIMSYDNCAVADFVINDITLEGYEFIENIREDNNWNQVKNISKKVGSSSLDVLVEIAKHVISQAIMSQFGV